MGELNHARRGHGVFFDQNNREFIVVGGQDHNPWPDFGPLKTERCSLNATSIRCTLVYPVLTDFAFYPEFMRVSSDYCEK